MSADPFYSESFSEYASGMAAALRRLADDVERNAKPPTCRNTPTTHVERARDVVNTVLWGVANLHLDTLIARAERADMSAREAFDRIAEGGDGDGVAR